MHDVVRARKDNNPGRTARRALRRERERLEIEEAARLGVVIRPKLQIARHWTEAEDAVLLEHRDSFPASVAALSQRSPNAVMHRRKQLGLSQKLKSWTTREEKILRDNYLKVTRPKDLIPLLPGRDVETIRNHLTRMGLRIVPPASDTGSAVLDAIKDRCRKLGYTMADLDRIAGTGNYFSKRRYYTCKRLAQEGSKASQLSGCFTRAIAALGGTLRVDWPDDGESIDTIDVGEG